MTNVFENNEYQTNRLLININWLVIFFGYSFFYIERMFDNSDISYITLAIGLIITVLLCSIAEVWYRSKLLKGKAKAGLKFYIMGQIVISIFIVMVISKDPYLFGLYFYPFITAVLYYDDILVAVSIILNILSILILTSNNLIEIGAAPTKPVFITDIFVSIVVCAFLLVAHIRKSKRIIETIRKQEENLVQLNQSLESRVEKRTKELQDANDELNSQQQELMVLNQTLIKSKKYIEGAYRNMEKTQTQLVQHEKMASLGSLVAGIVHEINTPIGAVICNIDLHKTILHYMKSYPAVFEDNKLSDWVEKLDNTNQTNTIACSKIVEIIRSLKNFARLDEAYYQEADIHIGIENTLVLLNHRIRDGIEISKVFGDLPRIMCYPSQLNQVFMNLLLNAIEAIKDNGTICISTFVELDNVYISIKDTGVGVKSEHLSKIFDPGFTTKGAGVGKGLGLPTSYNVIEKHAGTIYVDTEEGVGSEFIIQIPMKIQGKNNNMQTLEGSPAVNAST